jgi:NitT/TauT family transport system substrate-binding protein
MRRIRSLVALLIAFMLLAAACGGDEGEQQDAAQEEDEQLEPARVSFLIGFFPTGNTSVFFLARDMGFFEEEALDVDIQNVLGDTAVLQSVVAGRTDIGYADYATTAVAVTEQDVELTAFMGVTQQSPMGVVSPAESEITKPDDLVGKTLTDFAGSSTQVVWPVFLQKNGLEEDDVNVELVDPATRLTLVAQGQADGAIAFFVNNGPDLAEVCDCKVNSLEWKDFGISALSNGLVSTPDFLAENGDVAARFVRAVAKAMEVQAEDPRAAADFLLENTPELSDFNVDSLTAQIENFNRLTTTSAGGGDPLGFMTDADWENTIDLMVEANQIEEPPEDVRGFFTNDFITSS